MKFFIAYSLLFLLFYIFLPGFLQPVSAHLAGQPPFFKIDGVFTTIYPVQASPYTKAFTFPQDIPISTYLVGKSIDFTLEEKFLPFPTEYLPHLTFLWDFGDHQTGTGLANTHIYDKPGSYEIVVKTLTDEESAEPQLMQSTLLTVLPKADYVIPKPTITIGGKEAKEYPLGFIETNFQDTLTLSVKFAKKPSGNIARYLWDLDDGTTAEGLSISHHYTGDRQFAAPILRVIDSNGISVDVSEVIVNKIPKNSSGKAGLFSKTNITILLCVVGIILLVLGISYFRGQRQGSKSL